MARQVGIAKFKVLHFVLWHKLLYFCDSPHKNLLTTQKFAYHTKTYYRTKFTCHARKAFVFDDKHSINLTLFKLKFVFYVAQNA